LDGIGEYSKVYEACKSKIYQNLYDFSTLPYFILAPLEIRQWLTRAAHKQRRH